MASLKILPLDTICACLFSRADGQTFHWAIILPFSDTHAHKLHATNRSDNWWRYEDVQDDIIHSVNACLVVELGAMDSSTHESIGAILKKIPMDTPAQDGEQRFTCRIWFRQALRELHAAGVIICPDVMQVEANLTRLAQSYDDYVWEGKGPKLVVASTSSVVS
ncbi:hypothetical protein BOTBODRAFT_68585 [Botryobasidium botryosum FD-172 SS1]|uniref:Uncharacterized protein n=1 Tax=Botryobasidium botryosum (strain FD-172 SS1) TaxID=930990 RepID=A0A067M405_BOTB1|nr:hypothetical protein BOTBODRAFT_68585 [Botryobasidium botryosum FD-172 SS1]